MDFEAGVTRRQEYLTGNFYDWFWDSFKKQQTAFQTFLRRGEEGFEKLSAALWMYPLFVRRGCF